MVINRVDDSLLERAARLGAEVGNTPLIRIRQLVTNRLVKVYAKQEWKQLSGSVKCRAGYRIIMQALKTGELHEGKRLLDATSGNTGIAYAHICERLNIPLTLCMPENASKERKQILESLGADIIYTSPLEGTDGAQVVAADLAARYPDTYFYADQYKNDQNWQAHYHTTASEILDECPDITCFATGLGTSGTFVGTGRRLREIRQDIELVSFQPDSALHGLEGWKHMETAVVPEIYDPTVANATLEISTEEAYDMMRVAFHLEGLELSPSSAANLAGVIRLSNAMKKGVIVTMLPDDASKYTEVFKKVLP